MHFGPPPTESRHLEALHKNATEYFRAKLPGIALHGTQWATFPDGRRIYFKRILYQDEQAGIKYRVIVIDGLGTNEQALHVIASYDFKDALRLRTMGTARHNVPSDAMAMSPRIYIYTNRLHCDQQHVVGIFRKYREDVFVSIIDESAMHQTLFISYGSPDESAARQINDALKSKGVTTWFFPDDSVPGDKLHRMMSEGVDKHDRTLLLCSRNSLSRSGVLNEIERLLEREAREGGSDLIIPVALDDFIFNDWNPERADVKRQITSRVVSKLTEENFDSEMGRILTALRR